MILAQQTMLDFTHFLGKDLTVLVLLLVAIPSLISASFPVYSILLLFIYEGCLKDKCAQVLKKKTQKNL